MVIAGDHRVPLYRTTDAMQTEFIMNSRGAAVESRFLSLPVSEWLRRLALV